LAAAEYDRASDGAGACAPGRRGGPRAPGIDPELLEHAHAPFVRGEGAGAGSGLGLAIVTRLTKLLGGRLVISSRKGEGTTVEVRLPVNG